MPAKIILLTRTFSPTAEIYITHPLTLLAASRAIDYRIYRTHLLNRVAYRRIAGALEGAHVIVSRSIPAFWIDLLKKNRRLIKRIAYLIDDDFSAATGSTELPESYRRRLGKIWDNEFPQLHALADSLIVTSKHLEEKYNSTKTALLEPVLSAPLPPEKPSTDNGECRICYYATGAHTIDLEFLAPVIEKLLATYQHVNFDIIAGREVPVSLRNSDRVTLRRQMGWKRYKQLLADEPAHIGLAPLMDIPFNQAKSFVKLYDFAALGAAGIYSDCAPYNQVIHHGQDGLLIGNTEQEWFESIAGLVENPATMTEIACNTRNLALSVGDPARAVEFWRNQLGL
jgi:hypothetical protein